MGADGGGPGGGGGRPLSDADGRLNAAGRAFVADWIAGNGSGVGFLRRVWPATWRRAMAVGMTAEDVGRCCEDATVDTAARWEPAKGAFSTLLAWVVRQAVQKGIDERLGWRDAGRHKPARVSSLDEDLTGDGLTLHHSLAGPDLAAGGRDAADALREALRKALPNARDREILELRYGLTGQPPLTMREAGRRYGISRGRVEQIERRALAALRGRLPADFRETILGA